MAFASGASTASKVTALINTAVNIILSSSMQLLWSMVNTLQVIVHLPLLNIRFPQNAQ